MHPPATPIGWMTLPTCVQAGHRDALRCSPQHRRCPNAHRWPTDSKPRHNL